MLSSTYGLPHIARHVITRIVNPRFLSEMSSYDVVVNIWQARACHILPATSSNAL
jgi:hypothetical protein